MGGVVEKLFDSLSEGLEEGVCLDKLSAFGV